MNVKIQSIHFTADAKLLGFIEEKVKKLNQLDGGILHGDVFLRLDKADDTENKITEIKVQVAGTELFAKKQCKTFEEATDLAVEALKTQVKKHKEKVRGL